MNRKRAALAWPQHALLRGSQQNVDSGLKSKERGVVVYLFTVLISKSEDDIGHVLIQAFVAVEGSGPGRGGKEGTERRKGRKEGRGDGGLKIQGTQSCQNPSPKSPREWDMQASVCDGSGECGRVGIHY